MKTSSNRTADTALPCTRRGRATALATQPSASEPTSRLETMLLVPSGASRVRLRSRSQPAVSREARRRGACARVKARWARQWGAVAVATVLAGEWRGSTSVDPSLNGGPGTWRGGNTEPSADGAEAVVHVWARPLPALTSSPKPRPSSLTSNASPKPSWRYGDAGGRGGARVLCGVLRCLSAREVNGRLHVARIPRVVLGEHVDRCRRGAAHRLQGVSQTGLATGCTAPSSPPGPQSGAARVHRRPLTHARRLALGDRRGRLRLEAALRR